MDLFFIDYDFVPMLVQENYLNSFGDRKTMEDVEKMANAADFISLGESINRQVRAKQDWSLLPNLGFASSLAPTQIIQGNVFYPRFPEILGKYSSMRKIKRLLRELKQVLAHRAQANKKAIQMEYIPFMLEFIFKYLKKGGAEDVQEAISFMDDLGITNDHLKEHLLELNMDKNVSKKFDELPTATKSSFTRSFNKSHQTAGTKTAGGKKGKQAAQ